jgi:hypothetical protein
MKRTGSMGNQQRNNKLSLRSEMLRILTEQELALVVAGNCVNGSQESHGIPTGLLGVC